MARALLWRSIAIGLMLASGQYLPAQQATVRTPLFGFQDSFYERFNVGWGFQHRSPRGGFFFDFNSPAVPTYGGYDPNADARFGMARRWGNSDLYFNFTAGQGSTRTMTMTAPSLTTMNGVPGSIQDTTIRPFVTGLIPVVGNYPVFPFYPSFNTSPTVVISPLAGKLERLKSEGALQRLGQRRHDAEPTDIAAEPDALLPPVNRVVSTAEQGDLGVDEIRREKAAMKLQQQAHLAQLVAEAQAAERAGQLAIARVRYQQAAAKAEGNHRKDLLAAASKLQPRKN